MPRLLIIDDEPGVRYSLREGLSSPDLRIDAVSTGAEALAAVRSGVLDAAIVDVRLPDMSGLEVFDQLREIAPRLPVIVVTAFDAADTAIQAMKRGAFEVLIKPIDLDQLQDLVSRAVDLSRLRTVPALFEGAADDNDAVDYIVGRSAVMQEVCKDIGRVAPQDVTVLILGESGTGKELVARAIYQHSRRANKPFLAINCAAIPETLLESELLGHEKGAFTGADRKRIGKFEQADGGTLFLDEIGDMSPATQAKVLRVLQDQQFERVGGSELIRTDVRVIAATNYDLEERVAAGTFRADLYYRLNVFVLRLPPLRGRKEDIPVLVEHFLKRFARPMGKPVISVSPQLLEQLTSYTWPGNIRELQSVVKAAIVRTTHGSLSPDCLPASFRSAPLQQLTPERQSSTLPDVTRLVRDYLASGETDLYRKVSVELDRVLIEEVLRYCEGNQGQASELLGISRTTLRAKLRTAGMSIGRVPIVDPNNDQSSES